MSHRHAAGVVMCIVGLLAARVSVLAAAPQVHNDIQGADPILTLEQLLAPPTIQAPQLSPDGTQLIALAPVDGVPNSVLIPVKDPTRVRALTHDTGRGFQAMTIWEERAFRWAPDGKHVAYIRDDRGDENWSLYSLEVATGASRRLTPGTGVRVRGLQFSWDFPSEVLFSMNDRDATSVDYYRADLRDGTVRHVTTAKPYYAKIFDHRFEPRLGLRFGADMSFIFDNRGEGDTWSPFLSVAPADTAALSSNFINDLGGSTFSADNSTLLAFSTQDRDAVGFVAIDMRTGKRRLIAGDPKVDVKRVLVDPLTYEPQAYEQRYTVAKWIPVGSSIAGDLKRLAEVADGELVVESRSRDGGVWLVHYSRSDAPDAYFAYDRATRAATKLFVGTPQLEGLRLSKMYPVVTKSSDGYDLVSYIAYPSWIKVSPAGIPEEPQPVVTIVHGGPSDERAEYIFAPLLQWLTNRGYGVFLVNFRGSPGFGRAFMNAQNHEWGGAMNRDVIEQVDYLVRSRMADAKRLAVFGGSYGGYETLVAMTKSPGVFACGIAVVGPANLETFLDPATMPPDWSIESWAIRVGDPRTAEGRALLKDRSPINFVAQTKGKMLIVQGANDVRVPRRESDQIVMQMAEHGVDVAYLLFPDEGHGIIRPQNNRAFFATTEIFLGTCLGGRYVGLTGELEGSSVRVPHGSEYLPGIREALARRQNDGMGAPPATSKPK
jgi:dipeptidyl aminopeptidase/acylaminoacyl peptidase